MWAVILVFGFILLVGSEGTHSGHVSAYLVVALGVSLFMTHRRLEREKADQKKAIAEREEAEKSGNPPTD